MGTLRHRSLELLGLWALAVAQPVFALATSTPEFFTERKTPAAAIVVFAVAIVVVVPALVLLAEVLADGARRGWGRGLHDGVRFVLLSVIALQLLNELDVGATRHAGVDIPGWGLILAAVVAALGILELLRRSDGARMFLRFLAVAGPGALLLFLASAPLAVPPATPAARADRPVPIVMIVMDELPTTSLLKGPDRLDTERVPNFARLAREGTFYPNATTVSDQTTVAVPAMLSGRRGPEEIAPSAAANWPQNLFSLLEGRYRLDVREPITGLCPAAACPRDAPSTPSAVGSLASEAPRLAFLSVVPNDLVRRSPLLGGAVEPDPRREVRNFIAKLRGEHGPTLDFLHVLTPHRPWGRLPSGRRYRVPGQDDVPESARETLRLPRDRRLALQLWRAHLLQVGYADRLLGQVIDHLKRGGIYDRALLVVAADHGVSFRPGQPLRDITRENVANIASVPLFIKQPGGRGRGTDLAPARTIDVLPTILDVIEARPPPGLEGRSLLRPLRGDRRVRVLSTRSAYVETTIARIRADHARWLKVQRRDVIGSPLWKQSCRLPDSGC
ncbi:MAG: sulfatase-like hydrolase/transferase [Actinomycetota bacterium]|nr:sulfatase-like hydrolase/transferase [Actinomycetota bacterium]